MENYRVESQIGSGSFGSVSLIRRKSDDKKLVWKELRYGQMNEKEKAQIVAEVNILRELRHPCIVRYYDRIIDKKTMRLYIVMEHCGGGDLARLISTQRKKVDLWKRNQRDKKETSSTPPYVSESFIWNVLGQVVLSLKECHRHTTSTPSANGAPPTITNTPILHRDLKPANILLDERNNVKLCDFGLATELSTSTTLARTKGVGTPYYMSPELVNNKRYDERSDIWSLGCIIYELAALRPPFDANNQVALAVKINEGRFDRLPRCFSEELMRAVAWMLRRDIDRRPKVEDLERLPSLVVPIREVKCLVREQEQQIQLSKIQSRMEKIRRNETEIQEKLASLEKREASLACREMEVARREKQMNIENKDHDDHTFAIPEVKDEMRKQSTTNASTANNRKRQFGDDRTNYTYHNAHDARTKIMKTNVPPPPPQSVTMGTGLYRGPQNLMGNLNSDNSKRRKV